MHTCITRDSSSSADLDKFTSHQSLVLLILGSSEEKENILIFPWVLTVNNRAY